MLSPVFSCVSPVCQALVIAPGASVAHCHPQPTCYQTRVAAKVCRFPVLSLVASVSCPAASLPDRASLVLLCSVCTLPMCCSLTIMRAAVLAELREERVFHDRHHGRVRAFPHKEGNYATHVYIAGAFPVQRSCAHMLRYCLWKTSSMHKVFSLRDCKIA